MESEFKVVKMTEVQHQVVDLLEAIDNLVDWKALRKVIKKKYSIYSKRVAAVSRNSKHLEDFVESLLKDIAGDQLFVTREKSDKLRETLNKAKENEEEVLNYLKKYPYLSVVLLGSRRYEKSDEEEPNEVS